MKNKISLVLLLVISAMLVFSACDVGTSGNVKQELTIEDITIRVGDEPVEISTVFSIPSKVEYVEYEYSEGLISIKNNKVTAIKEGKTQVTAKTFSCTTNFTVTCLAAIEYIVVDDTYAWFNEDAASPIVYPASEVTVFLHESLVGEQVVLTCDSDAVSIDGNKITALREDTVEVTATAGDKSTTFLVHCKGVNLNKAIFSTNEWKQSGMEDSTASRWKSKGTPNSTIFIGDSFFDPYFFNNFNSFYSEYDAVIMGIGGTRSYQWELYFETILKDAQAKNVVVNLGNNNVYNDGLYDDADATIESLERYFTLLHGRMPNANVYALSITARYYDAAWKPERVVKQINTALQRWCEGKDWITFVDLQDEMTYDKLIDNIHPKPSNYSIIVDALYDADIEIEVKQ